MESIKKIFFTKDSLFKHITLFSISGIMSISLLYFLSGFFYHVHFMSYFFIKSTIIEGIIGFLVLTVLFIIMLGYIYKLSNLNLNGKFEFTDISLNHWKYTPKILIISTTWVLYFCILEFITNNNSVINFLNSFIQIFVGVLLVIFSKDFKIKKLYFNPITLLRVINKMVLPSLKFVLIFCIGFFIIMGLTTGLIIFTNSLETLTGNVIKVLWASFVLYLFNISNIIFVLYIGDNYRKEEFLHIQETDNL